VREERLEVVKGSGNVFRDLGQENSDLAQFKAILAAEIIKALDRQKLSVRGAQGRTGIAAADFSRIRNADLRRFTVDRLMLIINRLGSRVQIRIRVRPAETVEQKHVSKAALQGRQIIHLTNLDRDLFLASLEGDTRPNRGLRKTAERVKRSRR
jgi:predicted XRE-type DNA-binding protein